MNVFRDVAPHILLEIDRRSRRAYCLRHQGDATLMMNTVSTSETSVNFYQTIRHNILEDSHLHSRRSEKLKYRQVDNDLQRSGNGICLEILRKIAKYLGQTIW
jgi:hypothetical protein